MSRSPVGLWLQSPKFRRAFALSAVVLATGGLVLYKAPDSNALTPRFSPPIVSAPATGKNAATFSGPGAHGTVSLSHSRVLSGQTTPVYAEVTLTAEQGEKS